MVEERQGGGPLELGFVKELYLQELENKHKLDSRMPTLVVILSGIAGLLYYSVHAFTPGAPWFNLIIATSIVLSAGLYLAAFVYLIRGTLGHTYGRIPSAKEIASTFKDLQDYHRACPDKPGTPESDLDENLITRMLQATDRNTICNLERGARYYVAMLLMAGSVGFALVGSSVVTVAEKLHEIRGKEEQMANEEKPAETVSPKASDQPAADPAQTQPAPERPVLPENTLFRGNDVPLSTRVSTGEQKPDSSDGGK